MTQSTSSWRKGICLDVCCATSYIAMLLLDAFLTKVTEDKTLF